MANKKHKGNGSGPRAPAEGLQPALDEIQALLQAGDIETMVEKLHELRQRHPQRPEILRSISAAEMHLGRVHDAVASAELLTELEPANAQNWSMLGGAALSAGLPVTAERAYARSVDLDPSPSDETLDQLSQLSSLVEQQLSEVGLAGTEGRRAIREVERINRLLNGQKARQAHRAAEDLLKNYPQLTALRNNLSLSYWQEGDLPQAIAMVEGALEWNADDIHAQANLIRFLCLSGRIQEAKARSQKLKRSTNPASDRCPKIVEALSYVGDDEGIVELFLNEGHQPVSPASRVMMCHLAAVAGYRLGQVDDAHKVWDQCIDLDPSFDLAVTNLEDLENPPGERHAPWPFSLHYWVRPQVLQALVRATSAAARRDDADALERSVRRFLDSHPEITGLVPLLLERGDESGRKFALRVALAACTEAMAEALVRFAQDKWGPDSFRVEAARAAFQLGVLEDPAPLLWIDGEQSPVWLSRYEITNEQTHPIPPEVHLLHLKAMDAFRIPDYQVAEALLNEGLRKAPGSPQLLNALSILYSATDREEEGKRTLRAIVDQHPDYVVARTHLAQLLLKEDRMDDARELLRELEARPRFHFAEFGALCALELELALMEGRTGTARVWLKQWEYVDGDHPGIPLHREMIRRAESVLAGEPAS